jgi:hypothetical protein
MRAFPRWAPALLASVPLFLAAPASADRLTLGSDLTAKAASSLNDTALIEAHGQDTAFWPLSVDGADPTMPADGQIVSVKVKGTVFREPGAAPPANLIHFQALSPAAADGSRVVQLTSADFYLPIDQPNTVTTYEPENLCVKRGGVAAFNNIGGFQWGGSLSAPLDPDHYHSGAPFGIFGSVRDSGMARFSGHDVTKNGDTLTITGANNAGPGGTTYKNRELLMQVVLATGDDRSEPCGGPRRHPDGSIVAPKVRQLRVAGSGTQQPYVTRDRRFTTGIYCESDEACAGSAIMKIGKRTLATIPVNVPAQTSFRVPMRLSKADFRRLNRNKKLNVTYILVSQFGGETVTLTLKR